MWEERDGGWGLMLLMSVPGPWPPVSDIIDDCWQCCADSSPRMLPGMRIMAESGSELDTGGERWLISAHRNPMEISKTGENKSGNNTRFSPGWEEYSSPLMSATPWFIGRFEHSWHPWREWCSTLIISFSARFCQFRPVYRGGLNSSEQEYLSHSW